MDIGCHRRRAGRGGFPLIRQQEKEQVQFNTAEVAPANIVNTVSATGTIEPVTSVTVGTQVSGIVSKLYVDYNSVVKKDRSSRNLTSPI